MCTPIGLGFGLLNGKARKSKANQDKHTLGMYFRLPRERERERAGETEFVPKDIQSRTSIDLA